MLNAAVYVTCAICAGLPLNTLYREAKSFHDQMLTYRQDQMITLLNPNMQLIANFMGLAPDCLVLTGDFANQDAEMKKAKETGNLSVMTAYCRYQCMLAYYMNKYSLAMASATRYHSYREKSVSAFGCIPVVFFEALAALALARSSRKRRRYKAIARRCLKLLRKYESYSPSNCTNKVKLVEAEMAVIDKKLDDAVRKYCESIEAAKNESMLSEQALACERAGLALRDAGREHEAQKFLTTALTLYESWGAKVKVEQMRLRDI